MDTGAVKRHFRPWNAQMYNQQTIARVATSKHQTNSCNPRTTAERKAGYKLINHCSKIQIPIRFTWNFCWKTS